jgi:hypothetical protein
MAMNYNQSENTAATGGMKAPKPAIAPFPPVLSRTPEDSPMLTAPSERPWEPVTSGSDYGPGADSSVLGLPSSAQANAEDMKMIVQMLPRFIAASKMDGTPETFKQFVNYLRRMA